LFCFKLTPNPSSRKVGMYHLKKRGARLGFAMCVWLRSKAPLF
jgi:hypothetical protein